MNPLTRFWQWLGPKSASPNPPNFMVLDELVACGAQPTSQGWQWLWDQGYRAIVKLNTIEEGSDDAGYARGMSLQALNITTEQQLGLPGHPLSPSLFTLSIASVRRDKIKTYVHCGSDSRTNPSSIAALIGDQGGQDRTGTWRVFYRMLVQGWTYDRAYKEFLDLGGHPILHGLHECIESLKPK